MKYLITSPKGGVGKTALAALLAVHLAESGRSVLAVGVGRQLAKALAIYHTDVPIPCGSGTITIRNLEVCDGPIQFKHFDDVVFDEVDIPGLDTRVIHVTENSYLAVSALAEPRRNIATLVVRYDPRRALRMPDIEAALAPGRIIQFDDDPLVARAVDAGLLVRHTRTYVRTVLEQLAAD